MVNIVDITATIAQVDQGFDTGHDIFAAQCAHGIFRIQGQTHIHFHPAHCREIITLTVKEQGIKQCGGRVDGGRLARTHHAINIHQRCVARHILVHRHCVAHVSADIHIIDIEHWDCGDTRIQQLFQRAADDFAIFVQLPSQLITGFHIDGTGFLVNDIFGNEFTNDLIERHQKI